MAKPVISSGIGTNQSSAGKTTENKTAPASQGVDLQRVVDLMADLMYIPRERIVEIPRQSEGPATYLLLGKQKKQGHFCPCFFLIIAEYSVYCTVTVTISRQVPCGLPSALLSTAK